jgi:hypothetical protein
MEFSKKSNSLNNKSGYILAGSETLANILDNFIKNTKGRYTDNFTREDISKFFSNNISGFLHSFGQSFSGRKSYKKYNINEANVFNKCKDTGFFEDSNMYVDSGGFQVSIGKMEKNETELLIEHYHNFLSDYSDVYQRAFILDLPPGPDCKIFNTFKDVYEYNKRTYLEAANFPKDVLDKIVFILHFRTPKLWNIYTHIMRDQDLFNNFKHHATGGIVANMRGDMSVPCIIYTLPIVPLLNECIRHKRNYLNFHILGGANFRDIFFYELFREHVKNVHNIELNITYDSSGLFKALMIGRFIIVKHNNIFKKMDIRSDNLNKRFLGEESVINKYRSEINRMSSENNFKPIQLEEVYNEETGTFFEDVKVYTMLYMLFQYREVQQFLKEKAKELYPLYLSKDYKEFSNGVVEVTKNLNSGKLTKKQTIKSHSVIRSLDMLHNLDEDYCKYIVNNSLGKDEFHWLESDSGIERIV